MSQPPGVPPGGDQSRQVLADLRDEIENLGRIVDEQERTIAGLRRENGLHRQAIGWRLQLRLEGFRTWMLRTPVLRQIYRTLYRALEIWVDEGFLTIFARTFHKIGLALRGRDFLVEDRDRVPRRLEDQYELWIRRHGTPPPADARASEIAALAAGPLVSVLMPLGEYDPEGLDLAVSMLQSQIYARWELCVAMPADVRAAFGSGLEAIQAREPRVRVAPDGAAPAWAGCLEVATGEFIGTLEAGDRLSPDALFELVHRLVEAPATDVVYSDEDALDSMGRRGDPFFKPEWSPDLLLCTNFLARAGLFRASLVQRAGGMSADAGLAQVYDLTLRVSELTDRIARVPKVLCHQHQEPVTLESVLRRHAIMRDECRALEAAFARRGLRGRATPLFARSGARSYAARFELAARPLVSIIIPTRNKRALLQTTIESICRATDYDRYEIIVVDNGSTDEDAVAYLGSLPPRCRVLQWNERFNYSAINNFGVRHAGGEQLLFLNNDVEVIRPDWLTALLEHAQRPEVGAVGARLIYADGRIQHAGVVVGINGAAANAFRGWPGTTMGRPRLADLTRNTSAVTGACMMMPRRVFDEAGGFDERLRVVLNDVDLCLKIRLKGYLIVYTPHALLYHYEGSSRGLLHPPPDQKIFEERWASALAHCDPYYNPNLSSKHDDWSLWIEPEEEA